jgi:hypothetical protein
MYVRHLTVRSGIEKEFTVIRHEPSRVAPPSVAPLGQTVEISTLPPKERAPRRRQGSGRSSFSVRRRLLPRFPSSSSRRPQISAPSNFRHVHSESFHFPDYEESRGRRRPSSFRPLELSIYGNDTRLSPILPPSPPTTPPARVIAQYSPSSGARTLSHERSCSTLSFHIPRRPVPGGSVFESPLAGTSTPQRPSPARMRAVSSSNSSPSMMDDLVERVATAMAERDKLQEQIDDVIERQSIYISSRPSTAHGMHDMEPMPDIPALPPDAPSFSQRLSSDRPRTGQSRPSLRTQYQANSSRKVEGRALPPPLPLALRPPLRKKKSFSHVSSWLFTNGQHKRDISLESITNLPKPITGSEGFYQIAQPQLSRRSSFESVSSVSDWSAEDEQTVPTSWSPSSDATIRAPVAPVTPLAAHCGSSETSILPQRRSVGVAF